MEFITENTLYPVWVLFDKDMVFA